MCICTPSMITPYCKNCGPEMSKFNPIAKFNQPNQIRILQEKRDLDFKIFCLDDFIKNNNEYSNMHDFDKALLCEKLYVMREYSNILRQQIENF